MWLVGGPFTSPPLKDWHISNFGVVPVILLGLSLMAQTFPQAEWAQLLLSWCQNALWVMEPSSRTRASAVWVYISATPVFCTRGSSPFCGSGPLGGWSSCVPTVRVIGGSSVFWYFPSLNLWHSLPFSVSSSDTWPHKETFLLLQLLWISASSACHFMDSCTCRWLCVSWPSV